MGLFRRGSRGDTGHGRRRSVVLLRKDGADLPPDSMARSWPIGPGDAVVGRDEICDVQIVDPKISRRHLLLRHDSAADAFFARDLESANGTRVNGRPLDDEHLLVEGDVLEVGNSALRFTARRVEGQVRGFRTAQFGEGRLGTMAGPLAGGDEETGDGPDAVRG